MKTSNIGLIGLAVMGENLALNMESKGFTVSVYNRTAPGEEGVVDRFMSGRGKGKNFIGTHTIQEFVESIERPRKIMLMVKAGAPVDELMAQLIPYLSPGDVIIDGGNSDFHDTERRVKEMEAHGMYFVGTGISGGEIGALYGPSVMPGGSPAAWPLVKDVLQSIAAKLEDGTPCCQWIGPGGAGHFVKMVHNGIEYGDMQLISEAVYARMLSSMQEERKKASSLYPKSGVLGQTLISEKEIKQALYAAKLVSYAQGFSLLCQASKRYDWQLDYGTIAKIWRKGCIIRSVFLEKITQAYEKNRNLENLLFDEFFIQKIESSLLAWRQVVAEGALHGVALPAMSSGLSYFDGLSTPHSAANLIQAQRDYFGAHTYERVDWERGKFFHTNWTGEGGKTVSGTYNV